MNRRTMMRTLALLLVACGAGVVLSPSRLGLAQDAVKQAPIFEVDPFWPRPLPNHWVTGSTIGLSIDAQDRVWTIHRPNTVEDNFKAADIKVGDERGRDDEALPSAPGEKAADTFIGKCCKVAPPVLVYDQRREPGEARGAGPATDTTGRTAITASRSITKATSGWRATATRTRRC